MSEWKSYTWMGMLKLSPAHLPPLEHPKQVSLDSEAFSQEVALICEKGKGQSLFLGKSSIGICSVRADAKHLCFCVHKLAVLITEFASLLGAARSSSLPATFTICYICRHLGVMQTTASSNHSHSARSSFRVQQKRPITGSYGYKHDNTDSISFQDASSLSGRPG